MELYRHHVLVFGGDVFPNPAWDDLSDVRCVSEAERSERNTFAERLSAVEAIANAISVVSSNSSGNRTGSSSSRGSVFRFTAMHKNISPEEHLKQTIGSLYQLQRFKK